MRTRVTGLYLELDRVAHEYTGFSGYSQKQGHRGWLLVKGNRKRKALSVGEWVLVREWIVGDGRTLMT